MAKINQIQKALMELDGGSFQKIADSYLLRKGYSQINPIGSVLGSNKVRKGTPDTLIPSPDGKYVFGEHTTIAADQVYGKFCKDIAKCLDESKTGIPVSKINEIVLCFTSELSPENIDNLRVICEKEGVNLNLFGIGAISYDILEKFPSIAKNYLGIEVDTGQIVPLDVFVTLYEKNKLTTTLSTLFHFREEEKKNILSLIDENNLVIISGQAGVGKSRIAIECYQQFIKENESYKAYCLFNQGIDLFEDVKAYFSDSGNYLIFVDDANRVSGFQYIIQLLQSKRSNQNFKIIVTVRDYALDKIREICQPIDSGAEISLKPFTDEEIKELVQDEFEINNHLYLERIVDISHGNPRVAVMAAQVAKDSNSLDSIRDVSELYDKYYSSIKADLDSLKDENILRVAGIISFYRSVDRTNNVLMSDINKIFGIPAEDFWEMSKTLHDMEVLDMFENEVVKVSDQVLATYLFYLVYFKEKLIDFSILITELFPQFKQRLIDAVNPILNTFDFDKSKEILTHSVERVWGKLQTENENTFLQLIDVFWFLKPTETLLFIQEKIKSLDSQDISIDDINFVVGSNSSYPEFLSTLPRFRFLGMDELNMSLDLFLRYAYKRPSDTPATLHCLVQEYGFRPDSYRYGYHVQHAVIDKILEYSNSGKIEYFARIFLVVVEKYLHTHFSSTKSGRGHTIIMTQFDLVESSQLHDLRRKILTNLFDLFNNKNFKHHILKLLLTHTQSGLNVSVANIVEEDAKLVTSFFKNALAQDNLYHCIVVQEYLRLLNRFNISTETGLEKLFQSPSYVLYDLLTNKLERIKLKLSLDSYREYKKKKIAKFTSSYSRQDYEAMLKELSSIQKTLDGHSKWQIDQGVLSIMEELAKRDPDLYREVIQSYLDQEDFLDINPLGIVPELIRSCGPAVAFNVISKGNFPSRHRWLFSYYQYLPDEEIGQEQLDALSELYETAEFKYYITDADFLLKYETLKKGFVAEIVKTILDRADTQPEFAHALSLMFNPYSKVNKQLVTLFSDRLPLLEDAYLAIDKIEQHADYDGTTFSVLLDTDIGFINKYLEDKFSRKSCLGRFDDNRDYSFIWRREDYLSVMKNISDTLFKYEQEGLCFSYYESFFNKNVHPQTDENILERQDGFLNSEINSQYNNKHYMQFLFSLISGFESERKLIFYKIFLEKNKDFDDFTNLSFEPMISSWSGSAVPMLQEKIDFYEKIRAICNSVELLKHRQSIEERIQNLRRQIQNEKKKDFTEAE